MKLKKLLGTDNPMRDCVMFWKHYCCVNESAQEKIQVEADEWLEWLEVQHEMYNDARSLLDGAYEVVELFNTETPSQVEWKRKWLEGARKHGASSL